jgi:hypothetical protein
MPDRRKIAQSGEPGLAARPLHEILGALAAEFVKAAASRDLAEAAWRRIYKEHADLAAFEPSRVRIVGATVSLPVAIHELGEPPSADAGRSVEPGPWVPAEPSAARFLYRTADLEKLPPELILRMDLTLGID